MTEKLERVALLSRLPLDQLKQVFSLEAPSLSTLFNSQDTEQRTEAASEGVLTNVSVLTSANILVFLLLSC